MAESRLASGLPLQFRTISLFVVLCVFSFPTVFTGDRICGPTPRTINQSFLQECFQATNGTICNKMWNIFRDAIIGQPYNVLPSNYGPLFDTFPIEVEDNQAFFELEAGEMGAPGMADENIVNALAAVEQSNAQFVSPTNVPLSRVIRAIGGSSINTSWCSNSSLNDFIYEDTCPCSSADNFQVELFNRFSTASKGTITYLTDGEKPGGAFRSDSLFSQYIVANLSSSNVQRVVIIDVHREGVGESCQQPCGTLRTLRDLIQQKSIATDCYNINGQVRNMNTTQGLAKCLAEVITLIQNSKEVRPSGLPSCFNITGTETAHGFRTTPATSTILKVLGLLVVLTN